MIIHRKLSKMKNKILQPVYKETMETVLENSVIHVCHGVVGAERVKVQKMIKLADQLLSYFENPVSDFGGHFKFVISIMDSYAVIHYKV